MELVVQLVLAIAVFGVTLSGGSLVWPKVTSAPRPQLLQEVHDTVVKTPIGAQAARIIGTDQINFAALANGAWNGIKNAAEKRATTIVMSQVTQQLNNQYEKLPKDQKKALQEIICKTATSSATR